MAAEPVIGLWHDPWSQDHSDGRSWPARYRRAVRYKANPRTREYMRALFFERWPGGEWVETQPRADWRSRLTAAQTIVLLYPDAIGVRFGRIESRLRRACRPGTVIRVLNGRRREFAWDAAAQRRLLLRRFFERSMLLELGATLAAVCFLPWLYVSDALKGRR